MANILLLVSQNKDDLAFANEVAAVCGLTVLQAKDMVDGVNLMADKDPAAIFIEITNKRAVFDSFERGVQEKMGLYSEKCNPNILHYISSDSLDKLPFLGQSVLFGHFVFRKFQNLKEDAAHYSRVIKAGMKERPFGLATLMKAGTKIQTIKVANSNQKQGVVEAMKNFVLAAKFQPRIAGVVANAIDEILMNAIFDAATDDFGHLLHTKTERNVEIKLEGRGEVEVQVGFDGVYLGILASDRYGSLDKAKLMAHISKEYSDQDYKLKKDQAGAGLGLGTVYRMGASLLFCSEARERTEVTLFFKRTASFKEFRDQFRFISSQFFL